MSMLLEGYTPVTILEKIAGELAELVAINDLVRIADSVEYAAVHTRDPEPLSDTELAHPLSQRFTDEN